VTAGLCLAGELSINAAITAGEFARAHQNLARGKPRPALAPVSSNLPGNGPGGAVE
jgi:hydroxymethylglutaryl-CoA reductase